MKTFENSKQKGMVLINPPRTKRVGTWSDSLSYDASVVRYGVTWYRVKGGMGQRGDREDWCADIEGVTVSIHDYHWNGDSFGANHGSFDKACKAEMEFTVGYTESAIADLEEKLAAKRAGLKVLKKAVSERKAVQS